MHWFLIEGEKAFSQELFLASMLSCFAGIEATLRGLMMYSEGGPKTVYEDLEGATLSNPLLQRAGDAGMRIELLAFPGEDDFMTKLPEKRHHVEIVRLRHNFCHGNVFESFEEVPETGDKVFTPASLQPLAEALLAISQSWSQEVGRFKADIFQA